MVYSAIRTPDGTVLASRNRHDYKTHLDANGETYMIDGGLDYFRSNINKVPAERIVVYLEDGHLAVREVLEWGTYGIDGDQPLTYVKLKDMSSAHIEAILSTQLLRPWRAELMKEEIAYRGRELYNG